MTRVCKRRAPMLVPLLLVLCWVGCSRPGGTTETRDQMGQSAPFQPAPEASTGGPSDPSFGPPQEGTTRSSAVPFADPQTLPAGTLLNVRLDSPISSGVESTFTAVMDDAVVVDGVTLVPRGATVGGRVESAIASRSTRRGFLRLTLTSIGLGGRDLPLQTSSLFARGKTAGRPLIQGTNASVIRLEQGRRLTFRLTEPVSIASQVAKSGH